MSRSLTLRLDDDTYRLFDEAAKAENRPLTKFIETTVRTWIRERRADATPAEPSQLQRAVDEAERGLAEGRFVDHAEVAARLRRWAAGEA